MPKRGPCFDSFPIFLVFFCIYPRNFHHDFSQLCSSFLSFFRVFYHNAQLTDTQTYRHNILISPVNARICALATDRDLASGWSGLNTRKVVNTMPEQGKVRGNPGGGS